MFISFKKIYANAEYIVKCADNKLETGEDCRQLLKFENYFTKINFLQK